MKRLPSIILAVIIAAVFVAGQSFYWEDKASHTEARSYKLIEILRSDMEINLRRIDRGEPIKEDTVLKKGLKEMQSKMERQRKKSILYKWFGWKVG